VNKQLGFLAALIAGVCLLVTCSSRPLPPPTGVEDSVVIVTATVEIEEKVSPFHSFCFRELKARACADTRVTVSSIPQGTPTPTPTP